MCADSEDGQLAATVLDEYMRGFQERNPQLRVFSAHLHMDEATPHLHIDFVPFTTGSKRGLDTRVSLKQALAAQGFKGGTRGDTEWSQWVRSEKEQLAAVMERMIFSGSRKVPTKSTSLFWTTRSKSEKKRLLRWTARLPKSRTSWKLYRIGSTTSIRVCGLLKSWSSEWNRMLSFSSPIRPL